MPNTYTQIHIQVVFAVRYRNGLIRPHWKEQLHQYTTGIIQNNNHKLLQINAMPDHVHIFMGMHPHQSISALVQLVKTETSKWIKPLQDAGDSPFAWQEGFGAFSYAGSQVDAVIRYVQNQQQHHQHQTFLEEYRQFLNAFEIDWEEQYIFKELE